MLKKSHLPLSGRAFTLIEIVVAMGLFMIGVLPLASNFFESYRQSKKLYIRNEALEKLSERMGALVNLDFASNFKTDKESEEFTSGGGKTPEMKEILAEDGSTLYQDTKYKYTLKITPIPQTFYGYGFTGGKIIENERNFAQLVLTQVYKDMDGTERKMALCSRVGQRSL